METKFRDIIGETLAKHRVSVFGFCSVDSLPKNKEAIENILPGARSVVVMVAPHSRSAINSNNVEVKKYDVIHTYDVNANTAHDVVMDLESMGYKAVAVPAFIPIDMSPGKRGMRGEIDWRTAGIQAGIGVRGRSGLLVTPEYGSAIRIVGVVTDAELPPARPLGEDLSLCGNCKKCLDACPAQALSGHDINKKKCGDTVFPGGFRAWYDFLNQLTEVKGDEKKEFLGSKLSMDLWQNFMVGNYYTCFVCQAVCEGSPLVLDR
jgi:epoxyqueuosine reductase QueG